MDQLVREGVFHVSFAHEAVLAQEDAQFGRVAAGHGGTSWSMRTMRGGSDPEEGEERNGVKI
jgi:hypothetical protein